MPRTIRPNIPADLQHPDAGSQQPVPRSRQNDGCALRTQVSTHGQCRPSWGRHWLPKAHIGLAGVSSGYLRPVYGLGGFHPVGS